MLLDIDVRVFFADDHQPAIRLVDMLVKGRHDWQPDLALALHADQFVERLARNDVKVPAMKEWARTIVEESGNRRPGSARGLVVSVSDLPAMVEDLDRPAAVVVEDGFNDADFVLAMAHAFGDSHIVRAEKLGWLIFVHAGGKDRMPRFAVKERAKFKVVVRVAALLDSDRKIPAQRTPNHDIADQIRAADGVAEVHVWEWCEMENYLPVKVWERHHPSKAGKIGILRTMIPQQRGYVDVKKSLGLTLPPKTSPIPADLPLVEADFAELGADAVAELKAVLAMIHRIL